MTGLSIGHELVEGGGVLLRVRGNGAPFAIPISECDAKRLAWGILADLDPEEAAEASTTQRRYGTRRTRSEWSEAARLATRARYLAALADGAGLSGLEVSGILDTSRGRANQELAKLVSEGLVSRDRGYYGRYFITDAGRAFIRGGGA